MMYEKEIDIYLDAKRQLKVRKMILTLCVVMLIVFVGLRLMDFSHVYLDIAILSVFIAGLLNADGGSLITYASKSKLLKIIERQINSDPTAIQYIASKKHKH